MFFTYVLRSNKDGKFYIGSTRDLDQRLKRHADGFVVATKNRCPLELVYKEPHETAQRASQREHFFKTGAWETRSKKFGAVPKRLRESSAKRLSVGSTPTRTFDLIKRKGGMSNQVRPPQDWRASASCVALDSHPHLQLSQREFALLTTFYPLCPSVEPSVSRQ